MKAVSSIILSVALTCAALVVVVASSGGANAAAACNKLNYVSSTKLGRINNRVQVTQLDTFSAPPRYSRTTTVEVTTHTTYRASAQVDGNMTTTIGNRWISKAEVRIGLALAAAGEWVNGSKTTVSEFITNATSTNRTFVFYRGATRYYGNIIRSYCEGGAGSTWGEVRWRKVGAWKSFRQRGKGAVMCGAGTQNLNTLAKKAYWQGCA